jgi:hypothetical protein
MEYRKLRIMWSAAWGLVALVILVLWVRSYWVNEWLQLYRGQSLQNISNYRGKLFYDSIREIPAAKTPQWSWKSERITPATLPPLIDNGHEPETTLGFGWFPARNSVAVFVPHWLCFWLLPRWPSPLGRIGQAGSLFVRC